MIHHKNSTKMRTSIFKRPVFLSAALLALSFALAMTSCMDARDNPTPDPEPAPTDELADYTLFIYGHSGGEMDDIIESVYKEMKPKLTDKKKIRVLFFYKYGNSKKEAFRSEYANEDEVLRFELTADTDLKKLRTEACFEEHSEYQLFQAQNLAEQLNWVAKTAPAKQYIVLLWGHGAGFKAQDDYYKQPSTTRAVIYDKGFEGQGMNMYEFKQALEESAIQHPVMIFCHNCLMGNLESLTTLRNLTDYFIASEHLLASNGYIVTEFLTSLQQTMDIEAATLRMFDNIDPWKSLYGTFNGDLMCIKAQAIEPINEQMDRLSNRLCEIYPTQRKAIDRATCSVYKPKKEEDLYDAADYAACLARETDDEQLKAIRDDLNAAFADAILVRTHVNNRTSRLDKYSLSVTIVDKTTFAQEFHDGDWTFTFEESYKATAFHANTGWGHWLSTNEQKPTGNPYGFAESNDGEGNPPPADVALLQNWEAGATVTQEAVDAFGGLDKCFAAEPIPDGVWERMQGKTYQENPYIGRDDLRHVRALHCDYDGRIHIGEMICNKLIAERVANILRQLYEANYPIQLMVLPDEFNANDEEQMSANNSSCFCYRTIAGTAKLSKHARGLAVDINTLYNPYYKDREDGTRYVQPAIAAEYCDRTRIFPYKIDHDDLCFKLFTQAGFEWGGDWTSCKDFQHFELIEE